MYKRLDEQKHFIVYCCDETEHWFLHTQNLLTKSTCKCIKNQISVDVTANWQY